MPRDEPFCDDEGVLEQLATRGVLADPPARPPLRLLTATDCANAPRRTPVVKGLLARSDLALLIGGPGTGKSLFAPLLGFRVPDGGWFLDHRVRRGPVLYVAAEDAAGMMARVTALSQRLGAPRDFYVIPDAVNLADPADLARVTEAVRYVRADLTVIDTFARAFPGLAENEAEGMGAAIAALRHLTAEGCAVLVLHHTPKAGTTARGHGSLEGDADVILAIERQDDGTRVVTVRKNRNGPEGARISFTIEVETLGVDDDGDAITAPVAVVAANSTPAPRPERRIPDQPRIAFDQLRNVIAERGEPLPPGEGFPSARTLGAPHENWRRAVYAALAHLDTPDAKRRAFNRAVEWLLAHNVIGMHDGWVWTVSQSTPLRQAA